MGIAAFEYGLRLSRGIFKKKDDDVRHNWEIIEKLQ